MTTDTDIVRLVDDMIERAITEQASDIHLEPTADGCEARFRVDGLLETKEKWSHEVGRASVTRLMVMAQLLTYRQDVPQEGRARFESRTLKRALDLRLAIMPTTHGLRAALRLPAELVQPRSLDELELPVTALSALKHFADSADSGMLIVTGPAGSGKTTTIYALLDYFARQHAGLSIVSLEDPVERQLAGVTQIEVSPFGQLTYERALRSMLRQDPQVLMLGEIRDAETAGLALQAALSGHRLICTLHASTPGGAIARLLEMGLEPFRLTSAIHTVLSQRLLRRRASDRDGYRGRVPIAQTLVMSSQLRAVILARADALTIDSVDSTETMRGAANDLVQRKITDLPEVERVLGSSN